MQENNGKLSEEMIAHGCNDCQQIIYIPAARYNKSKKYYCSSLCERRDQRVIFWLASKPIVCFIYVIVVLSLLKKCMEYLIDSAFAAIFNVIKNPSNVRAILILLSLCWCPFLLR